MVSLRFRKCPAGEACLLILGLPNADEVTLVDQQGRRFYSARDSVPATFKRRSIVEREFSPLRRDIPSRVRQCLRIRALTFRRVDRARLRRVHERRALGRVRRGPALRPETPPFRGS